MDGKELLVSITKQTLKDIYKDSSNSMSMNGVDLVEISNMIEEKPELINTLPNALLKDIVEESSYPNKASILKLVDKIKNIINTDTKYKYHIRTNKVYLNTINAIKSILKIKLTNMLSEKVDDESWENKCNILLDQIKNKEIITDLDFIDDMVKDYNQVTYEENIVTIMKYINRYNLDIMKKAENEVRKYNLGRIKKEILDDKIEDILDYVELSYKNLPQKLKEEIKKCDVDEVYETYELMKETKPETYGVLDYLDENSQMSCLCVILFSTPYSVRTVIDSIKDKDQNVPISLLKVLLNNIPVCFMIKSNEYITPKFEEYVNNINYVKKEGINYISLLSKNPLFFISNNKRIIDSIMNLEKLEAKPKNIINKCYKTLSINPELLLNNTELLKKNKVNLNEYFNVNTNYNLIKVPRLEEKLKYVTKLYKATRKKSDYEYMNKILISHIYQEALEKNKVWSEIE